MKINEIEINSFRGFSNQINFSLKDNKDNAADIVLFYAPNGTGKTSLVEALEWNITGEIKRLDDLLRSYNSKPKEGYLLKNKFSGEPYGTVKITLEDGGIIQRRTIKSANMNNDYNSGKLDNNINTPTVFKNFNTNILSQHNINEFLMSASTGNIFKAFFGLENNERDTDTYYSLKDKKANIERAINDKKDICNKIIKQKKHLENQIVELGIKSSDRLEAEKHNLVKALNERTFFSPLKTSSNEHFFTYIKNHIGNIKTSTETINSENILDLITKLRNFKKFEQLITEKIDLKNNLTLSQEVLFKEDKRLTTYTKYRDVIYSDAYDNFLTTDKSIKLRESILLHKKRRLMSIISRIDIKRDKVNLSKSKSNIDFLKYSLDQVNHYKTVFPSIINFEDINSEISLTVNYLTSNKELINKLKFDKIPYLTSTELEQLDICSTVKHFQSINEELNYRKDLLNSMEKKLVKIATIQKSVEQLKINSKKIIIDESLDSCPVCNTEFPSMEEVMNTIDSNMFEIDSEMNNDLKVMRNEISSLITEKNYIKSDLEKLLAGKYAKLSNEISRKEVKHTQLLKFRDLVIALGSNNTNLRIHSNSLDLLILEVRELTEVNVSNNIKLKILLEGLATKSKRFNQTLEEVNNSLSQVKLNVIENNTFFARKQDLSLLNDKEFKRFSNNKELILTSINTLEMSVLDITKNIEKFTADLNKISISTKVLQFKYNDIENSGVNYEIKEIKNKLTVLKRAYKQLRYTIKDFRLKNIFSIENYLNELSAQLKNLSDDLEKTEEYREKTVRLSQNSEQASKLTHDLEVLNKKSINYQDAIDESIKFFKSRIETKFNRKLLNDIFRIIDPSTSFVDLDIELDMRKNSEKMHIKSTPRNSDSKSSSVLFFSEAQTNILSISLFLSNLAFGSKDSSSTLIIDDPVQSMDDINAYSFIDLCRVYTKRFNKQLIITTHDKGFYNIFKSKLPENEFSCKYFDLSSSN